MVWNKTLIKMSLLSELNPLTSAGLGWTFTSSCTCPARSFPSQPSRWGRLGRWCVQKSLSCMALTITLCSVFRMLVETEQSSFLFQSNEISEQKMCLYVIFHWNTVMGLTLPLCLLDGSVRHCFPLSRHFDRCRHWSRWGPCVKPARW